MVTQSPLKIAIVGCGIAGLTAAHRLHPEHDLTLFEAGDHAGGHVHTHEVTLGGRDYRIDTGFIVFNDWTYPHFIALLDELGVDSQASDMSFSVSCGPSGLEYNGATLNSLFAQRANLLKPRFWGMLRDILRFNREAPQLLAEEGNELSLGDYLTANAYGRLFRDYYILPMGADDIARCKPVYEVMQGWSESTVGVTRYEALPIAARLYLQRIEQVTGVPIHMVSTSPDRDHTIMMKHPFLAH